MNEPEWILRQQGTVMRPQWCSCDNGFWMRALVDPRCHYHSDYGEELRALISSAADALAYQTKFINDHCCDGYPECGKLIAELRKAAE